MPPPFPPGGFPPPGMGPPGPGGPGREYLDPTTPFSAHSLQPNLHFLLAACQTAVSAVPLAATSLLSHHQEASVPVKALLVVLPAALPPASGCHRLPVVLHPAVRREGFTRTVCE